MRRVWQKTADVVTAITDFFERPQAAAMLGGRANKDEPAAWAERVEQRLVEVVYPTPRRGAMFGTRAVPHGLMPLEDQKCAAGERPVHCLVGRLDAQRQPPGVEGGAREAQKMLLEAKTTVRWHHH